LASSRFEFFLFWKKERVKTAVETLFGRKIINGGEISEKELSLLDSIFKQYPSAIWVETRERRTSVPGIEHLEQKYDDVLRGEYGLFAVMHDRYGRRVPGSLKVVRKQVHGKHVTLKPGEEKHDRR
jgi:cell division protein FtsI/penicillin-binding protein 2